MGLGNLLHRRPSVRLFAFASNHSGLDRFAVLLFSLRRIGTDLALEIASGRGQGSPHQNACDDLHPRLHAMQSTAGIVNFGKEPLSMWVLDITTFSPSSSSNIITSISLCDRS